MPVASASLFFFQTGNIFVNTGLLKVAQNEDQLAVVLGHEIAHALLGHGVSYMLYFFFTLASVESVFGVWVSKELGSEKSVY